MLEALIPYITDPATLAGALFLCLCGIANVMVHVLPVPKEDSSAWYKLLMKAVNFCASNFGKAKNANHVNG